MNLDEFREKLDGIDETLSKLFCSRMALSEDIARFKASSGMQIYQKQREEKVVERLLGMNGPAYGEELRALYQTIFSLSRARQEAVVRAIAEGKPTV